MRTLSLAIVALATTLSVGAVRAQAPAAAAPATAGTLPAGPAHDLMVRVCSACHAPEIAAQQRLSPAGWKDLVDTMASRGADASEAELAQITDYLAKNFPDKPAAK
ncbi:c-type cytochrome [Sphingomonas nostoxanthinifaciens]|uniref:c-type cytochrome n=1 Tax=Sphingomonas nostoxanthinifaciens TaxID=2872652 RepID=UPI001CC1C24B|nr:cytochrome c [Sphingomonas nostoxanthinifaciens]UAK24778.1 cytochrome c [Sphingomonas nostoxanthinifaciens]